MGTNINNEMFQLYAEPSFIQGMGTLFDVSGSLLEYNYSRSENEADFKAMASDWRTVGQDLKRAILAYRQLANEQQEATVSQP